MQFGKLHAAAACACLPRHAALASGFRPALWRRFDVEVDRYLSHLGKGCWLAAHDYAFVNIDIDPA